MARPVIATKLFAPRVRAGLVTRPRLRDGLGRGAAARLTLLSAPAGFGKTTLLAEWLDETVGDRRSVAWLSLDPEDSEPASFWTYVLSALRTAAPDLGSGALDPLATPTVPIELVLTTLVNELAATPDSVWLVLDDYHLVDGREIGEAMTFLLEHLPPQVHVVVSTRADPDLPLSRWRARGELVEIRAADLRFTTEEAAAYLKVSTGLELSGADVAALEDRTEGWIAALQLAAISLRGREDGAGFVARFAGDDRYIVDYLVEEVLRHQTDTVREFLVRSAVLDRFTGPLCDAVTGRDDGSELLVALERANLFIVPLDDRREWYRYHHLFADVLRARLLAEQPELVPVLHDRASRWHEEHDLTEEAIRHALAARDGGRAAHLIELAIPAMRRDRQEVMLLGWLKALPDEAVRRSPVLSVFYGHMLMASGDLDGVGPRLDDAERALAAVSDESASGWAQTDELRTLPATIAIYRASVAQARGDVPKTVEHAQRALDLAGPGDHLARGGAAGFLGLAAWAQGDVTTALETFTQAVASLHAAGALVDELSGTVVLADLWLVAGRPSTAARLYRAALEAAEQHGDAVARATAELHVGISEIELDAGHLDSATRHLERAAALGERASMAESQYRWFVARSRVALAEGSPDEAIALLDRAEQLYRRGFLPDVRPIAAMRARIWVAQGSLSQAAEWAQERGVSTTDAASYLSEFDHLTLARLVLAQHRIHPDPGALDQVAALLGRLLHAAESSGREGSVLEIRMLQALHLEAQAAGGPLSDRELHVLRLLDSELTGPEIARELFITHNTLRSHTKHIFTKLDVTSRRAAVRCARERGLI